ncbi:MAG: DMT family transporter [Gammaproteobacteria bacterium]|nr:DMT family transporter [Gammaproteobacteria bacterium]
MIMNLQAPSRKSHLDTLAIFILLVLTLFWGWQQVLVKATISLDNIPPITLVAIRMIIASLALIAWCKWRKIPLILWDGNGKVGVLAGILFALEFVFLYLGLQYTSASSLTIFLYTAPFWVAFILHFSHERLRFIQWIGIVAAFLSVVYAFGDEYLKAPHHSKEILGNIFGILAGMLWGLTTVLIRRTQLSNITPHRLLFFQIATSALFLPLVAWLLEEPQNWTLTTFGVGSILIQSIPGAFISYLIWMWMLGKYPATKLSSFVFLTPVFTLIMGSWWLKEVIHVQLLIALLGVGVGIYLVNKK